MAKRNILITVVSLLLSVVLCSCDKPESDIYSDMPQYIVNTTNESDIINEITLQNIAVTETEITLIGSVEETPLLITTTEETTATTTLVTTTPIITITTVPVTKATTVEYIPPVTKTPQIITSATPETVQYNSSIVYIAASGKGKKYHNNPKCSNMKGTNSLSVEDAVARGYTPCKKCYG